MTDRITPAPPAVRETNSMSRKRMHRGRPLVVAVICAVVLGVSACGSTGSDTPHTTRGGASASVPAAVNAAVEAGFKGTVTAPPPTTGPKASPGKTIWFLNCVAYAACKVKGDAFVAAAKVLGWKVKVVDDKADATTTVTLINQAISAHADGIAIIPMDCPLIKSGLQAAKAAHIPVLDYGGLDCDDPKFGGGDPLYTAPIKVLGAENQRDLFGMFGKADADFMLALLQQRGLDHATIVAVENRDQVIHVSMSDAFENEIKTKCPDCTIKRVLFTVAQQSAGKGPQIFKTGLLANPNADAIYYQLGSLMTQGLQTAIAASGDKYKVICCGDGSGPDIDYAMANKTSTEVAVHVQPAEYFGWAMADTMNRVFAGESVKDMPDQGGYNLYVDKDHPLTAPPVDFKAAYSKLWTSP